MNININTQMSTSKTNSKSSKVAPRKAAGRSLGSHNKYTALTTLKQHFEKYKK